MPKKDREMFDEIMLEIFLKLQDNLEGLRCDCGWQLGTEEEKESLIKEKESKMELIRSFGKNCYR